MKILLLFSLWLHFVRGKLKEKLQMNHHHLRSGARQMNFLSFWTVFCPSTSLTTWKVQNFEKMKQASGDVIILHKFTRNENHDVWFLRYGGRKKEFFLIFGPFFAFLLPLTTWKIKILKNKKKLGDIIVLHRCTINENHMMYGSWDMKSDRHNYLSF